MQEKLIIYYTDDDTDDLEMFDQAARAVKVEAKTFQNGKELIDAVNNPPPKPAIIFVDLNMPIMSGYDVIKKLKSLDDYADVPIVVLSTANDPATILKSRQAGADYYITKPTSFAKLKSAIEFTIDMKWRTFKPSEKGFVYKPV